MIYHLNQQQWDSLWYNIIPYIKWNDNQNAYQNRVTAFNNMFPNVQYIESVYDAQLMVATELHEEYWGTLTGDEKDINWILLQL